MADVASAPANGKNTASKEILKNQTQTTGVPSNPSKAGPQSWHSAVSPAIFPATGPDNTATANTRSKENLNIDLHTRTADTFSAVASEGTGEKRGESVESTTRAALVLVDDFSSEKPEPVAAVNNETEVWLGAGQPPGIGLQAKQVDLGMLEEGQGQTRLVEGQIGLQLVHTGLKAELETGQKGLEMEEVEAVPTRMESGLDLPEEKASPSRRLPERYTGPTRQPLTTPTTTARVVNHNMNLQEADTDINYIQWGS